MSLKDTKLHDEMIAKANMKKEERRLYKEQESLRKELTIIRLSFDKENERKNKLLNRLDYFEFVLVNKKNQILEISIKENYVMSMVYKDE